MIFFLALLGLLIIEIVIDYNQIKDAEDPHNAIDMARLALSYVTVVYLTAIDWRYLLLNGIGGAFIFWFIFDYGLNLVRIYHKQAKISFFHLGNNWLDRKQKESVGVFGAFVIKAILASVSVYYVLNPGEFFYWISQ